MNLLCASFKKKFQMITSIYCCSYEIYCQSCHWQTALKKFSSFIHSLQLFFIVYLYSISTLPSNLKYQLPHFIFIIIVTKWRLSQSQIHKFRFHQTIRLIIWLRISIAKKIIKILYILHCCYMLSYIKAILFSK